jgi:pyruvate dehydrogenase (quinone)
MRTPGDVVPGWDAAMAARRPVVVEAFTDPEVPPLPPHIEVKQAKKLMEALLKGDPRRWRVIKQSAKEMWAGLVT